MPDVLEDGRKAYRRCAWAEAHRSLSRADRATTLEGDDLERLATSAYLVGRTDEFLRTMDRAHLAHLEAGDHEPAARCGFWLGLTLLLRGDHGRATGWLARAERLVEGQDCAERGYLLLPAAEQQLASGDCETALTTAADAAAIGDRFGEADLVACARYLQGKVVLRQGRREQGLALLDEAMVAVVTGELSPRVTGLIYCAVVDVCRQAYAVGRAREWTEALAEWCARQPQMIAFTTTCLLWRSEIMRMHGAWGDALQEARRACNVPSRDADRDPPPAAYYELAEVHRLRGEFTAAEEVYRKASHGGSDPQPGLALLWLARGRVEAADAAIRRALAGPTDPMGPASLLPAAVEIMLAAGDIEAARDACRELEQVADRHGAEVLDAMASHARGAIELADGHAESALTSLRSAWRVWQKVEMPYAAARTRVLIGSACRALGDEDGGAMELEAARAAFERLGAVPDVARVDSLTPAAPRASHGLTPRELEVLRLVTTGGTNRDIASELSISEKTVERHLSNIFYKLNIHSKAGATAFAYEHGLV